MQVRHIAAFGAVAVIATTGAAVLPGLGADAASSGSKISFLLTQQELGSKHSAAAIMHGAINGAGRDVESGSQSDTFTLPGGTLRITHPDKDAKFSFKPDPKTCFATIRGTGTFTIGHGTGKYKGVTGSGKFTLHGQGFSPRRKNGSCNFNSDGGSFLGYATGSGTVTMP